VFPTKEEFYAMDAECTMTGFPLRLGGPKYDPLAPSFDLRDNALRLTCAGYNQLQWDHPNDAVALEFLEDMVRSITC
jgi:hypothetical protein